MTAFSDAIWAEINTIKAQLVEIQSQTESLKSGTTTSGPDVSGPDQGEDVASGLSIGDEIYNIRLARRALYSYASLASEMGLSKDMKQHIVQFEQLINIIQRTLQMIRLLEVAQAAMEAGMGPVGWAMLAIQGGGFAASMIVSSSKLAGGNV